MPSKTLRAPRSFRSTAGLLLLAAVISSGCAVSAPPPEPALELTTRFVDTPEAPMARLAPTVGVEESAALLAGFDWHATTPLREYGEDGAPALHYVMVYVDDREKVEDLVEMHLHHAYSPLLASERAQWRGMVGQMTPSGDGRGVFAFAFMPGAVYNSIRDFALQDVVLFRAIFPREMPAEALDEGGAISYEQLAAAGFQYNGMPWTAGEEEAPAEEVAGQGQALVILTARVAMKAVSELATEAARLVARALGGRDRDGLLFGLGAAGTADYHVGLNLMNTDPAFGGGPDDSAGRQSTPMRRAWGEGRGDEVYLEGVRVSIWSRGDGTVLWLPTLFEGHTDDHGDVHIEVAKNRTIRSLCVASENDAAEITELLTEVEVCGFDLDVTDWTSAVFIEVDVQHSYFNLLAQMTEGQRYLEDVVAYSPYKADVLVGPLADMLGSTPFAPCLGFPNVSADALVTAILGSVALVSPSTAAFLATITPLLAVDLVLSGDEVKWSRAFASHEYGHFAMCSMLFDEAVWKISTTWTAAVVRRLAAGDDPSADDDTAYALEAFADFFSAQVTGGVNYSAISPAISGPMNYCLASDNDCLEENHVDGGDFHAEVRRVLTTLHDAFDGWGRFHGDVPSNGDVWTTDGAGFYTPAPVGVGNAWDDEVRLSGPALRSFVRNMGSIGEDSMMTALADTMRDAGYDWCEACVVFALHSRASTSGTREEMYIECENAPIAGWLGTTPQPTAPSSCNFRGCVPGMGLTPEGCVECAEGVVSDGRSPCVECPFGSVVIDNQCAACDTLGSCETRCPGHSGLNASGVCEDCAFNEVSVLSQCESCPSGTFADSNANLCVADCPPGTVPEMGGCFHVVP